MITFPDDTVYLIGRHNVIMDENVHISSNKPPVHLILQKDTNEKYKSSFKKALVKICVLN